MADHIDTAISTAMADLDSFLAEDSDDAAPEAATDEHPEPEADEPEDLDDVEAVDEDVDDVEEDHEENPDEDPDEPVDEDDEDEETDGDEPQTFTVKVDGEEQEVSADELVKGYQRHADYTRKTQALKDRENEVGQLYDGMQSWYEARAADPGAWISEIAGGTDDPAGTLAAAIGNTQDPNGLLAWTIRTMAENGQLAEKFVESFGLEDVYKVADSAANDHRVERLEKEISTDREERAKQARTAEILAEYDRQWQSVVSSEGLELSPEQAVQAKVEVMRFAKDQRIGNLETAYAAMAHKGIAPKGQPDPATPKPKPEPSKDELEAAVKRKRATRAMARKPVGGPGAKPAGNRGITGAIDDSIAELGIFA